MNPTERVSPRFWDFTWSGTDVADGLQEQAAYVSAFMDVVVDQGGLAAATIQTKLIAQTGTAAQRAWSHMSDPAARVVMVTPEQFLGLPLPDDPWEFAFDVRPPFPVTYFDLAGPSGLGIPINLYNPPESNTLPQGSGEPWTAWLCGVIFVEHSDALGVIPILRERKTLPHGLHVLIPSCVAYYVGDPPEGVGICDVLVTGGMGGGFSEIVCADIGAEGDEGKPMRDHYFQARDLASRCLPLLMLLESVNVDLEEAPLRPKQEKTARRKARVRPLIVAVQRKTRRTPTASTGEPTRKLTVQFEVRGHFKHFGPGTQVYRAAERCQPEKIRDRPGRGPCVRYWCPPYVKGPVDAPLILKARRISGDDARRGREEEEVA